MASDPLTSFDFSHVTFVDLGMSLTNEDKAQKFYFVKMVHEVQLRREVHLLAISEEHLQKWEYCLGLKKEADHEDQFIKNVKVALLKKI
jgi:hypothetical protein